MSKKDSKKQYLDAKYVIEYPNEFDCRDVARAQEFCNTYEAGQHEACFIPQNQSEKQAWFIVTLMRNMNKDEVEMLCKNLLARFDIDLGKFVEDVEQIKDMV